MQWIGEALAIGHKVPKIMRNDRRSLEAYIKYGRLDAVLSLLNHEIGTFTHDSSWDDGCHKYAHGSVTVIFVEHVEEYYLGVEIHGADNWETHTEFARFLSNRLNALVRCEPGADYPDVDSYSDIVLEIFHGIETLVNWR